MDATDDLRRRADAGDAAAMMAYAKMLMADGAPASIEAGIGCIQRAAAGGDGEACARLAALTAAGMVGPPSWETALDLLQRAAERGCADAQADLRFLARGEGNDFAALRRRVDIEAWIRPPAPVLVRSAPRILTCASFMSAEECARLIARARPKLARADVYDPASGVAMVAKDRSNSKAELLPALDFDVPLILVLARISSVLGLPATHFELTNVLHYRPGEHFAPHYDFLDDDSPGLAADKRQRGQRIVTFLVYLNDDFEGGETSFPRLNYSFKGRTGDALMFGNVDAKGAADHATLHAGLPPTRGEKWLLSQWVRDRPQGRPKG